MTHSDDLIVVAKIAGPYGVKGWVKIQSFTDPVDNILHYSPWYLRHQQHWTQAMCTDARVHVNAVVAHFEHVNDRDAAAMLRGVEIAVERANLPDLQAQEYYWTDLIGMDVVNTRGERLGAVSRIMPTGANDVLVVTDENAVERLIPFVQQVYIQGVDPDKREISVAWELDF